MGSNFSKIGRPIFVTKFQTFSLCLQGEIRVEDSHFNPNKETRFGYRHYGN